MRNTYDGEICSDCIYALRLQIYHQDTAGHPDCITYTCMSLIQAYIVNVPITFIVEFNAIGTLYESLFYIYSINSTKYRVYVPLKYN